MREFEIIDRKNEILVLLSLSRGADSRKTIMTKLLFKPKNCNQIAREAKLDWWTVQKHLNILMRKNMVRRLEFGRIKFYKLTPEGEKALMDILSNIKRAKVRQS
jgi:predicted transcriptional regulator